MHMQIFCTEDYPAIQVELAAAFPGVVDWERDLKFVEIIWGFYNKMFV